MAVIYTTAVKTSRMTAVVTDIGSGGKLKLFTAGDVLLATFTLAATAGTVSAGVLTFSDANGATAGILNTTAVSAGTATKCSITTSADVDIITGLTAGTTGTDMILDNNVIAIYQNITINSAAIAHG